MYWKTRLQRLLFDRRALTAALFLAITAWGAVTAALGALNDAAACGGYSTVCVQTRISKSDPAVPSRSLSSAATALDVPARTESWAARVGARTAAAETAVTRALEDDHSLIQLYGLTQRLAGRTVLEDAADERYAVVKLPGGSLTFTGAGEADPAAQAAELKRLQTALEERNASLLYLQAPSKLEPGSEDLPVGVTDTSNACADALLAELDALEVDYLDFRQTLKDAGGAWDDWFYTTDHHWNQRAAFVSFQALCQKLETYDQAVGVSWGVKRKPISIPERYTDPDAYASTTLQGFFLGSQGKRTGSLYAGTDDFVLQTPDFPTLMRYETSGDGVRRGDAAETVLFPERVERRDWFDATPYTYYAGGDYAYAQVTNYYNPEGPRILLIRDSYGCAVTPYLALVSSQLTTVDPRYFSGDLLTYVDYLQPDVVLILYSSGMVRDEGAYRLLAQPGSSKSDALRWKKDEK